MKKRFVTKKKGKSRLFKLCLLLTIILASCVITFNLLVKNRKSKILDEIKIGENLFTNATNQNSFLSLDLLDPKEMFKLSLNYIIDAEPKEEIFPALELVKKHENDEEPLVYIYNTHDTESYDSPLLESYNIKYTTRIGSYILSDYLKDLGIPSYVETESMGEYLKANGLSYNSSYKASRHYLEERLAAYPSIKYTIDLHRDSVGRNVGATTVDGKSYARVMFVVGVGYECSDNNMAMAKKISEKLGSKLSRGILERSGSPTVKGIYNQDVGDTSLLIEVGGVENTIEEVNNTLELVAKILFDIIKGE